MACIYTSICTEYLYKMEVSMGICTTLIQSWIKKERDFIGAIKSDFINSRDEYLYGTCRKSKEMNKETLRTRRFNIGERLWWDLEHIIVMKEITGRAWLEGKIEEDTKKLRLESQENDEN
jgi:hypothetical protein